MTCFLYTDNETLNDIAMYGDLHLDNYSDEKQSDGGSIINGGNDMPSVFRKQIKLDNGQVINLAGNDLESAIKNLLPKLIGQDKEKLPLFKEYVDTWFDLYFAPNAGQRWIYEKRTMINKHILPFFGNMRLDQIRVQDIQKFLNGKKDLAQETTKKLKNTMSQILDSAIEDGLIQSNAAKSKRIVLSNKKTERQALTSEQMQDILKHIGDLQTEEQLLLALFIYTGMRRGEVLALRWKDIDLDNNLIHVKHSTDYINRTIPVLKDTKSKAGRRTIPIVPELKQYLSAPGKQEHFLFHEKNNETQQITNRAYECMWSRIGKKINLYGATAHVFRHTFITKASQRLDPKTLQAIAGHSKCDITLNRYAHAQEELVEQAGNELTGMYT